MWTKVEKVEITQEQLAAFNEAAVKREALRRVFNAAVEQYTSGLEVVGRVEHDLWEQIRDANGFDFGDRDYRLIPGTKTLQSRPNRHGGGDRQIRDDHTQDD